MAVAVRDPQGALKNPDTLVTTWRERITQARTARKPFEKIWLSNLAFAAGQHWLVWNGKDGASGRLQHISELDQNYANRNLYTANRIGEYIRAQLGELSQSDDRPELLTAQEGDQAEEVAAELNAAVEYGWEHEWNVPSALSRATRFSLTMGVSALQMRLDPTKGDVTDHQPYDPSGQPVTPETHPQDHAALIEQGTLANGQLPEMRPVHEGRTCLVPHTAFQILTPPGVVHEDDFPWEVLVGVVHKDEVFERYGVKVEEDTDIASAMGLSTGQTVGAGQSSARLRDHVWFYKCFARPCSQYPQGQSVKICSNSYTLLEAQDNLPYEDAAGDPASGIVYLHWWRLDDRFWSQSFIEPMKDPQRVINEVKTGELEIMRRGYPKVFVKTGSLKENPQGLPLEVIELDDPTVKPDFHQGVGPGDWMFKLSDSATEDLSHASTLGMVQLGENPANADTYSALALLNENEQGKRAEIRSDRSRQIGKIVEYGVYDIRNFWPPEKTIYVSGDEGRIQKQVFDKTKIPDFFMVKVPSGAPAPSSQAAELKKIDAIWAAAAVTVAAPGQPDAHKWVDWYARSLNAGETLELPEVETDAQVEMAKFENFLMLDEGIDVQPADYDLLPAHIPEHREAQNQARAAGDMEAYARLQRHVDASVAMQQANAMKVAAAQNVPSPLAPPGAPAIAPPLAA